jgi:hypothetical protein
MTTRDNHFVNRKEVPFALLAITNGVAVNVQCPQQRSVHQRSSDCNGAVAADSVALKVQLLLK